MAWIITSAGKHIDIIQGTIDMPLCGIWIADLMLDETNDDILNTGDSIQIQDGTDNTNPTFVIQGTVAPDRNNNYLDSVHCRIVGGAGGMLAISTPHAIQNGTVNDVIKALLGDTTNANGVLEKLSNTSDSGFTGMSVPFYSIFAGQEVDIALAALMNKFGTADMNWRFLSDGSLFIGKETWPQVNFDFECIIAKPIDRQYELATETILFLPGQSVQDIAQQQFTDFTNISRVLHNLEQHKIRSHVWAPLENQNRSLQQSLSDLVSASLPNLNYFSSYEATINTQSSDFLTVDITPLNTDIPFMQKIPIFYGCAGITQELDLSNNPTCLLSWRNADPTLPYVYNFPVDAVKHTIITTSTNLDLGAANPSDYASLGTTHINALSSLISALQTFTTALQTFSLGSVVSLGAPLSSSVKFQSDVVVFIQAIQAYINGAYLSSIVRIK